MGLTMKLVSLVDLELKSFQHVKKKKLTMANCTLIQGSITPLLGRKINLMNLLIYCNFTLRQILERENIKNECGQFTGDSF